MKRLSFIGSALILVVACTFAWTAQGSAAALPFFDDLEKGVGEWKYDGYWNLITAPQNYSVLEPDINPTLVTLPDLGRLPSAFSGSRAWWFGESVTGTFIGSDFNTIEQGAKNGGKSTSTKRGSVTSPPINLKSATHAVLNFKTWWEIEGVDTDRYDIMGVEISTDGGVSFSGLGKGNINPLNDVDGESWKSYSSGGLGRPGEWLDQLFDLTGYVGHTVQIRFRFDSRDALYNGFRGWFIDDVRVTGEALPAPSVESIVPSVSSKDQLVDVLGEGFVNGAKVKLGAGETVAMVVSSGLVQFTVPEVDPGVYDVTVTNPDGQTVTVVNGLTVSEKPPPDVTSISPASAEFGTSVAVTIKGEGFVNGALAEIGGIPLTNVVVVNDTTITGLSPDTLYLGNHNVKVINPDTQFDRLISEFTVELTTPYITLTPEVRYVSAKSASITFEVGNLGPGEMDWTAASDADWLTITAGASGTNGGTITVLYGDNPAGGRTGSITVTAAAAVNSPQSVKVLQVTVDRKIIAPDGGQGHGFAASVSIDEDYAIVGAPNDDDNGPDSGSAYILKLEGGVWVQQAKLTPKDGAAGDHFGWSVCLSGDYALVGAPDDDDNDVGSGSAYLFKRAEGGWSEYSKLTASDGAAQDLFGSSVSLSGDYALVGAYGDDDNGEWSGAAYVFKRDGDQWTQQTKLVPEDGVEADYFGWSVSLSGKVAVVGAPWDDGDSIVSGAAYVYALEDDQWVKQAKLVAGDGTEFGQFGTSVSVSGSQVVVGAIWGDGETAISGAVYAFRRQGTKWNLDAKLAAGEGAPFDYFGTSVHLYKGLVLVGADADDENAQDAGSAYIFVRGETGWIQLAKLTGDGSADDRFGCAVGISGHHAVVGASLDDDKADDAGAAYIFDVPNIAPAVAEPIGEQNRPEGFDTYEVADLDAVFVDANGDPLSYTVTADPAKTPAALDGSKLMLSSFAGFTGVSEVKITADDGQYSVQHTFKVIVTANKPPVVLHPIADQTRQVNFASYEVVDLQEVFEDPDGNPLTYSVWTDGLVTGSIEGTVLKLGSVPGRTGACLVVVTASDGLSAASDNFVVTVLANNPPIIVRPIEDMARFENFALHRAINLDEVFRDSLDVLTYTAVSQDGHTVVQIDGSWLKVGSVEGYTGDAVVTVTASDGVYAISDTFRITVIPVTKLVADDGAGNDRFGKSASVSGDYAIFGAPEDDDNGAGSGSAYVYRYEGGAWGLHAKLTAADGAAGDLFGTSLAVSGDYAIVGAPGDDDNGEGSGAAYVFKREGDLWTEQAKLTAEDGAAADFFGCAVSLWGDYAVVGASGDDGSGSWSGAAYVFRRDGDAWTQDSKLVAGDGAAEDLFGGAVAIYGDRILVGASWDDGDSIVSGAAYVFQRGETGWSEAAKLTPAEADSYEQFGKSVALWGDWAVVGAVWGFGHSVYSGSAYIFKWDGETWSQHGKLTAGDGCEQDGFGQSVSIYGDYVVVGAPGDDEHQTDSGSAYLFKREGSTWVQKAKLMAGDSPSGSGYGAAVATSGHHAVVGAYLDDESAADGGSAYVYTIDNDPPVTVFPIPDPYQTQGFEGYRAADMTAVFHDANGDVLTYSWTAVPDDIVTARVEGGILTLDSTGITGTAQITVTADDGKAQASETFTLTVFPPNPIEVANPLHDQVKSEDFEPYTVADLNVVFSHAGAETLTYGAVSDENTDVQIKGSLLVLSSRQGFTGVSQVTVTARSGEDTLSYMFNVTVLPNSVPAVARPIPDQVRLLDFDAYAVADLAAVFVDADGDPLTYTASGDGNVVVTIEGSLLKLDAVAGFTGVSTVTVTASDGKASVSDAFDVTVAPNNPPRVASSIADQMAKAGFDAYTVVNLNDVFEDADNDRLEYAAVSDGNTLVTISGDGTLRFSPVPGFTGASQVIVTATDGYCSVSDAFIVTVLGNTPPVVVHPIADQSKPQDFASYTVADLESVFSDPDGDPLSYEAVSVDGNTVPFINGTLLGLASKTGFTGVAEVRVTAGDGEFSVTDTFVVRVAVTGAPVVASPIEDQLKPVNFPIYAVADLSEVFRDPDGQTLTYLAPIAIPTNIVALSVVGSELRMVSIGVTGVAEVTVRATDGLFSVSDTFVVTVVSPGKPVVSHPIADQVRRVGFETYTVIDLDTVFDDPEGDALTYTVTGDGNTTPTIQGTLLKLGSVEGFSGISQVTVTASDGTNTASDTFEVRVTTEFQLFAADGTGADYFGFAVGVSGDYALVGANGDDDLGSASGSVYVFFRAPGGWEQYSKLTASDGAAGDGFGAALSISGDHAVVGARGDDDNGTSSGSAYVFQHAAGFWTQKAKLAPSDGAAGDEFGVSVAVSGNYAVVGARGDDDKGSGSGSAYVFRYDGSTWSQQAKLTANDGAAGDEFGISVAISGGYIVVGARQDDDKGSNAGAAYVFRYDGSAWAQQAKLRADDGAADDQFGHAVAVSGQYAAVSSREDDDRGTGSGSVYVFKVEAGVWTQQAKLTALDGAEGDKLGTCLSMDGDIVIAGAVGDDDFGGNSGSACLFKRVDEKWSQHAKLTAADGAAEDWFGSSVAVSGGLVVVGAYGNDALGSFSGTAYVYDLSLPLLNAAPSISAIEDQVTLEDRAVSGIGFKVSDLETPAESLTVFATSSNAALLPQDNILIGGSGSVRTLSFIPATNVYGTATVEVVVTDGNHTTLQSFVVTVQAASDGGDVDNSTAIDLADAILVLRLAAGNPIQGAALNPEADVNGDGRLGLEEAIYVLQEVAEMRPAVR